MSIRVLETLVVRFATDVSRFNAGLQEIENRLTVAVRRVNLLAAGVTAGLGYYATRTLMEFDEMMTETMSIMKNGTDEVRTIMEDALLRATRGAVTGPAQLTRAYRELAAAGYDAANSIGMISTVERFAALNRVAPEIAARDLSRLMRTLNLMSKDTDQNAKNFRHLADVITSVAIHAQVPVESFVHGLERISPTMRMLNRDITEAAPLLAAFTAHMGHPVLAATATNQVMQNLARMYNRAEIPPIGIQPQINFRQVNARGGIQPLHMPTGHVKDVSHAWTDFGIRVFETGGRLRNFATIMKELDEKFQGLSHQQKFTTLTNLGFQRQVIQSVITLLGSGRAMSEFYMTALQADGAMEHMYNIRLRSFSAQLRILKVALERVSVEIGRVLVPYMVLFNDAVQRLINRWDDLPSAVKQVIAGFIGSAVAAHVLRIAVSFIIPVVLTLIQTLYSLTGIPLIIWFGKAIVMMAQFGYGMMMAAAGATIATGKWIGSMIEMGIAIGKFIYEFALLQAVIFKNIANHLLATGATWNWAMAMAAFHTIMVPSYLLLSKYTGTIFAWIAAVFGAVSMTNLWSTSFLVLDFLTLGLVSQINTLILEIMALYTAGGILAVMLAIWEFAFITLDFLTLGLISQINTLILQFLGWIKATTGMSLATLMLDFALGILDIMTLGLISKFGALNIMAGILDITLGILDILTFGLISKFGLLNIVLTILDFTLGTLDLMTLGLSTSIITVIGSMLVWLKVNVLTSLANKLLALTSGIASAALTGLAVTLGAVAAIAATVSGLILIIVAVLIVLGAALIVLLPWVIALGAAFVILTGQILLITGVIVVIAAVNAVVNRLDLLRLTWAQVVNASFTAIWGIIGFFYNFQENIRAVGNWFSAFWARIVEINFARVFVQALFDAIWNIGLFVFMVIDIMLNMFSMMFVGFDRAMNRIDQRMRVALSNLRLNPFRNTDFRLPELQLNTHVPEDMRRLLRNVVANLTAPIEMASPKHDNLAGVGTTFREIALNRFMLDSVIEHNPDEAQRVHAPGVEQRQDQTNNLLERLLNRRVPLVGP